jgi:hypothetical protein
MLPAILPEFGYVKYVRRGSGEKFYCPWVRFGPLKKKRLLRRSFRRAHDALEYGERVGMRCKRMAAPLPDKDGKFKYEPERLPRLGNGDAPFPK